MPIWDSAQYLRFSQERTQPSRDLVARIPLAAPVRLLDMGCGPGNSTAVLADRYGAAGITGVDNSPQMLAAAREAHPELRFSFFDMTADDWSPLGHGYDVVFSNACIQWLPDHDRLLPRMLGLLAPGGCLAVQLPLVQHQEMRRIFDGVSTMSQWAEALSDVRTPHALEPADYFDILAPMASDLQIWQTTYYHRMASINQVLEWYRGSSLRPYLQRLGTEQGDAFLAEVRRAATQAFTPHANGEYLLPFPRLFLLARR